MTTVLGNLAVHCPGGLFKETPKKSWSIRTHFASVSSRGSRYNRELLLQTRRERKKPVCPQEKKFRKISKIRVILDTGGNKLRISKSIL